LYRKFSADYIFTGHQLLPDNYTLITTEEGMVVDVTASANAGTDIEKFTGILSPGFINAHCHLELSHMKGYIPERTGLIDFVLKVIFERHFDEEEILAAIEKAENEMLQNGRYL
jgi:aminodeoxyfutalosine deaminase